MIGDWSVGVVIPAHDEVDDISAAIGSVQRSLLQARVTRSVVVVVADACRDDTAEVARAALGRSGMVVEIDARCVGIARSVGANAALGLLDAAPAHTWLLGLDADSLAPPTWVSDHLAHAAGGVECVTGIVDLAVGATPDLRDAFVASYSVGIDAVTHPHIHGTNFGIRADTLLAAGNWPHVETGEDRELWHRIATMGRRTVQDPGIVVATSARLIGRAPSGFAGDLAATAQVALPRG